MGRKLTLKRRKFVTEYLNTGNATEAAKQAGYSPKTAYSMGQQLLNNIDIQNEIRTRTNRDEEKKVLSALERREFLTGVVRDTNELMTNRLKAADLLNKMTGEYLERREVEVRGQTANPFGGVSTEDIKRILGHGKQRRSHSAG